MSRAREIEGWLAPHAVFLGEKGEACVQARLFAGYTGIGTGRGWGHRDDAANGLGFGITHAIDDVFLAKRIGLFALVDFAEQPEAVLELEDPEFLKAGGRLVATDEAAVAIVGVIVLGAGGDEGGEFFLIGAKGAAVKDDIDALDGQIVDVIDLVLADHLAQLAKVVLI